MIWLESADPGGHGSGRSSGWDKANNTALQCMYIQLLLILTHFFLTCVWHISLLSCLASLTARRQWLYLCYWCKWISSPSPKPSAKGDEGCSNDVQVFSLLDVFNPPALMLSYSLWTSPSPWHWIFWMQRWRTAVKRRWAWNAPGPCALVIELMLQRDILSMSAWLFFLQYLLTEKRKTALCFLDPATNDWWTTGWNADQNSHQVHRWGKFLKWFHLNETLKSTFVDPELCSRSQKLLYLNWIMY